MLVELSNERGRQLKAPEDLDRSRGSKSGPVGRDANRNASSYKRTRLSAIEEVTGRSSRRPIRSGSCCGPTGSGRGPKAWHRHQPHWDCRAQGFTPAVQQRRGTKRQDKELPATVSHAADRSNGCEARDLRESSLSAETRDRNF